MISSDTYSQKRRRQSRFIQIVALLLFVLAAYGAYVLGMNFSPTILKAEATVEIPEGYSTSEAALLLEDKGVIRSDTAMKILSKLDPRTVKSGYYHFEEGIQPLQEVRVRLSRADYGDVYTKVTIPEGSTRAQIAEILEQSPLVLSSQDFMNATVGKEGYLFPETYFFFPEATASEVVAQMEETFQSNVEELSDLFQVSSRTRSDIIIMASILERESGSDMEEMRTISGILWKRIDRGIPLQVDAPFMFTRGKSSAELTTSDLQKDGLYNTYTRTGLTPTPIGNPGRASIEAALTPIKSPYLFYLHDSQGRIHYGITHDDHVRNKQLYLN